MIYVFDSSTLINLFKHYYEKQFPTLWQKFDQMRGVSNILSVREVYNEVSDGRDRLAAWAKANRSFFKQSSAAELDFVKQIFTVNHFQALIRTQERLKGYPVADPFVIALARDQSGTVVTEEARKPNAAKIPNICEHFHIKWCSLEKFMDIEGWTF